MNSHFENFELEVFGRFKTLNNEKEVK